MAILARRARTLMHLQLNHCCSITHLLTSSTGIRLTRWRNATVGSVSRASPDSRVDVGGAAMKKDRSSIDPMTIRPRTCCPSFSSRFCPTEPHRSTPQTCTEQLHCPCLLILTRGRRCPTSRRLLLAALRGGLSFCPLVTYRGADIFRTTTGPQRSEIAVGIMETATYSCIDAQVDG